jgi:3-oxoacyl-[acyl-carrier-protein] synthase-1
MKKAISMAGLTISDINYINAHGTATVNNDAAEGMAIKNVFAENVPFFSSTKSFTGHTLAAAGALEAIVSLLAIKNDCAFPNLNFESPITEHGLTPITQIKKNISIKNVLSNSIGIGGFCASLILSKSK